jgi:inosose dehydratase
MFGAKRLVVGGGARRAAGTTDDDYTRLGRALDNVCDIAEEHGLEASYHPHLSTIVENPDELKIIMGRSRIAFCPDTAHLAAGGGDPAELIRTYPDRVKHVHLKDLQPQPFTFMPLGKGVLDFVDIVAALKESGYDSWLMVELDSYDGEPKDAAQISKDHLEQLLADAGIRRG